MVGPHYLQPPGRLWPYRLFRNTILLVFCLLFFLSRGWFQRHRGGETGQRKQPHGGRLCSWQLSVTCQKDKNHLSERCRYSERHGGRGGLSFISLSHLLLLSVSMSAFCTLWLFFVWPFPQTQLQAHRKLPMLPSFLGIRYAPYCLSFSRFIYLSLPCHQFVFFFYLEMRKLIPCIV